MPTNIRLPPLNTCAEAIHWSHPTPRLIEKSLIFCDIHDLGDWGDFDYQFKKKEFQILLVRKKNYKIRYEKSVLVHEF